MEKITIEYFKKYYTYMNVDGNVLWVDEYGLVVPMILQSILRKKALSEGINDSIFIGTVKSIEKKKKQKIKNIKQIKFNPFERGDK